MRCRIGLAATADDRGQNLVGFLSLRLGHKHFHMPGLVTGLNRPGAELNQETFPQKHFSQGFRHPLVGCDVNDGPDGVQPPSASQPDLVPSGRSIKRSLPAALLFYTALRPTRRNSSSPATGLTGERANPSLG